MAHKEFTCPECGCHVLEEVMSDVTVTTVIKSVGEGGDIEYGLQSNEGGEIVAYQCQSCGWEIPDVADCESLYEYLAK